MLPPMPELEGARHSWVPVDGFKMHVAELGPVDGRPVVCLHGWPQAWWCWHKVMPGLADAGFRVVAPDLRGHGWSETPGRGYEKARFAADVVALLDGLGLDRVDLIGHDWGAMAGFMAAIDHPDRFAHYLALGIVPPFPARSPAALLNIWRIYYQFLLSAPWTPLMLRKARLIERVVIPSGTIADGAFGPDDLRLYDELMAPRMRNDVTSMVYRSWLAREFFTVGSGRWSSKGLSVPTRLVCGAGDPVAVSAFIDGFEHYAEDMTFEALDGVGHFVPEEAPDATVERALALFRS
jgi:pimeloyl-ACP methyl ester carboxylesterase